MDNMLPYSISRQKDTGRLGGFTFSRSEKANPLLQFKNSGFTLLEMLVVISIIAILAAVIMVVMRPLELVRRARDANRLINISEISKAVTLRIQEGGTNVLCKDLTYPCRGSSIDPNENVRRVDGSGWIKVDFSVGGSPLFPVLPIDPINTPPLHFAYCADQVAGKEIWEMVMVLESEKFAYKMATDGGDNDSFYEVGNDLRLFDSNASCQY